ncbi:MAG: ribosome maturation factor RimP [Nitriliruptorales bacterium]|nr:ribosome maturation factor RimP [Nitriliruptorales bacterium]
MADPAQVIRGHVQPLADQAGLDLIDVQVKGAGARTLVRVTVDRKGGVDIGSCQRLSGDLSRALDESDPIASRYQLEVSSPGITHPLREQRDFDRVEGRVVSVRRRVDDALDEVKGTVVKAADAQVVLDVHGDRVTIAYGDIDRATQALPW